MISREILKKEYYENKLTQREIGRKYNISNVTISNYMKKYNLVIRDKKCDVLNKELLENEYIEKRMSIYEIGREYDTTGMYVYFLLKKYNIPIRNLSDSTHTLGYPELECLHKRWYDKNGNKILPRDIDLNPQVLANWYMGDGSMHRDYKHINWKPYPVFSCLKFNIDDKLWLSDVLERRYGFTGWVDSYGLHIHTAYTWNFVKLIVPYIVPCYYYKTFWRVNQRQLEKL